MKNTNKEKNANVSYKSTIIAIIIALALIAFAIIYSRGGITIKGSTAENNAKANQQEFADSNSQIPDNNVSIENGVQIIEIKAKGGYLPRVSVAKAGIPTIIRFNTKGTFDCSSSVRIPSMNLFKSLPQSGTTDIDLGTQPAGTLQGTCGMGMYPFEVEFK
jgi:hypothetical protein